MDANPVVFDISSDDEPAIEDPKEFNDDCNWLTELLRTVEKEKDDSDEVVVVAEYNPPKPKSKSKSSNQVADIKFVPDDYDDDCVLLDGDPDKSVAADVSESETGSDDGDDVLVVGEKGQGIDRKLHPFVWVPPIPRSFLTCGRFVDRFAKQPLCHCYVCDSLAPCGHWGTGVSTIDHCHATDKTEMWKTQREIYRIGKDAPIPVSRKPDTPVPMALPRLNQVGPLDIVQLIANPIPQNQSLTHNPKPQSQVSRMPVIRPCSSYTMPGIPNIIRQSRSRQSGYVQGRNRLLHRTVSQQALGIRNDVHRDKRPSTLGQRFVSSNTMFESPGLVGNALAVNQPTRGSLNMNCAPALGYGRNVAPLPTSKENPSSLHYVLPNANFESHTYQSSSQPNMCSVVVNTVPSRPNACSQPMRQSNDDQSLFQLGNQGQNVADLSFPDFDFCRVNNSSQSDQEASVESIFHGTVSNNEPSTVKQLSSQFAAIESAQFHYKDDEFDDSFFLNQAVPVVLEGFMPHDLNGFSPEPPAIDSAPKNIAQASASRNKRESKYNESGKLSAGWCISSPYLLCVVDRVDGADSMLASAPSQSRHLYLIPSLEGETVDPDGVLIISARVERSGYQLFYGWFHILPA
ncbi:unnamed protein product [Dovyalis caffra]|uniref:Uncharacterized protein n=1 Tax=Dovyalis caffra TaxID=77055 RepID=A0AAV1SDH8_9ROSI|nr:unnamed protein product [Dovyalis caffra]